jgi:riboflavin biosynthesis pyrimidine reductase
MLDTLMSHGLLDELRLWVHPFFFGRGGPEAPLYEGSPTTMLTFVDAKPLKSGTVILSYRSTRLGTALAPDHTIAFLKDR